jgi:hypothetical protein
MCVCVCVCLFVCVYIYVYYIGTLMLVDTECVLYSYMLT